MRTLEGKLYLSYGDIHRTVARLAGQILASGYDPDLTVAIGTGGFIPARILKTFLKKPILTVGIVYYDQDNTPMDQPRTIQWIDEVEKKLTGRRVLLVDEVDDSRSTLAYCLRELLRHRPAEIAVAVVHNKRYFCGEEVDNGWICYPWDAEDIDRHEALA